MLNAVRLYNDKKLFALVMENCLGNEASSAEVFVNNLEKGFCMNNTIISLLVLYTYTCIDCVTKLPCKYGTSKLL